VRQALPTRSVALLLAIIVVMLIAAVPATVSARPGLLQDAADLIEVGSGPLGERSFSLVGRSAVGSDAIAFYGYLSAVVGLDDEQVFTALPHTEQTARFTFTAELDEVEIANRADLRTTSGTGSLRIYFNAAGGKSWSDPDSFWRGQLVAEYSLMAEEILQRQSPTVGVSVGDGRMVQAQALEFTLDGQTMRFGRPEMQQRFRTIGVLQAESPQDALFATTWSGGVSVTGRDVTAVPLGGPTAAEASASPQPVSACAALRAWSEPTAARLAQAMTLSAFSAPGVTLESIDATQLAQAAEVLPELVTAQRGPAFPQEAEAANRLVLTALSTVARGVQGAAEASNGGDSALFAQAQETVRGGMSLMDRATAEIETLTADCDET
jgi:hypothetical protein